MDLNPNPNLWHRHAKYCENFKVSRSYKGLNLRLFLQISCPMKDNFSAQAEAYSRFRPNYPKEVIDYILSHTPGRQNALDLATGNGQVAKQLVPHFNKVYATDISSRQLEFAASSDQIEYREESAEKTSFGEAMFDLACAAQSAHWFNHEKFYPELYRILRPDGIFAVLGYGMIQTPPRTQKIIDHLYTDILGPYWDEERKYLDTHYKTLPFPLAELPAASFEIVDRWTADALIGYLETWSARGHYLRKTGIDPIDLVRHELELVWELGTHEVRFPVLLRLGRPFSKM